MRGCWALTAVFACAYAAAAELTEYPTRPIRIIVPNAPGSTTDLLGRIVFTRVTERLGKQIVVDNRPGAGGTLGMEIASRATADGYTLVGVAASMIMRFNREMGTVLGTAEARKLYFELGEEPVSGSPEDFGKLIREDYQQMGKLVKLAGITPE